ncbi:MAG: 6,7-dimethyl-8-ribityllumazine synthase [Candidatus Nanopelagicales bacterium]|nr:6,7-dimethyl-8-ribityllumazine synthase [Candidatus Nanopelagicales bacterium]MDZ4249679.1 6,7-dimethyl-8-ribityllumazine synthase [Candidatus Nanopelagicales bacterium]
MTGPRPKELRVDASDVTVAVIGASWHPDVMEGLLAGALRAAERCGVEPFVIRVPGAFELPVAARRAADAGFDAVVVLGAVIRGGTPHFDYVCSSVSSGLMRVSVSAGVPVGFGVLTCDDVEQALDRAGLPGSSGDKGAEAFDAAVATVLGLRRMPRVQRSAGFS